MSEQASGKPPTIGDQELEELSRLLKETEKYSFGSAVVSALRGQLAELDSAGRNPFALNRLLEDPRATHYMAALLLGLSQPFTVSVRVPGYAWLPYVTNKHRVLVDGDRRRYERFALNRVPLSEHLTGRRKRVRLTFVCPAKSLTAAEAIAYIKHRGFRPAHPIEGFELAKRCPDLLMGPSPVTILGRSLCLRRWPDQECKEPLPSYYLTLWGNRQGLTTYLEPTDDSRTYPDYALFLAAER